jgi:hypothetical protein
MALQFSNIPIKFEGLNRKVDIKQGAVGQLITMENCWQDKTGKYQKRFGYTRRDLGDATNLRNNALLSQLSVYRGELIGMSGVTHVIKDTINFSTSIYSYVDRESIYLAKKIDIYKAKQGLTASELECWHVKTSTRRYSILKQPLTGGFYPYHILEYGESMQLLRRHTQDITTTTSSAFAAFGYNNMIVAYDSNAGSVGQNILLLTPAVGGGFTVNTYLVNSVTNPTTAVGYHSDAVVNANFMYVHVSGQAIFRMNLDSLPTISYQALGAVNATACAIHVHDGAVYYAYVTSTGVIRAGVRSATTLATVLTAEAQIADTPIVELSSAVGTAWQRLCISGVRYSDGVYEPVIFAQASLTTGAGPYSVFTKARFEPSGTHLRNMILSGRGFSVVQEGKSRYDAGGALTRGLSLALCYVTQINAVSADVTGKTVLIIDGHKFDNLLQTVYPKAYASFLSGLASATTTYSGSAFPNAIFSQDASFLVDQIVTGQVLVDVSVNSQSVAADFSSLHVTDAAPNVTMYDGILTTNSMFYYYPDPPTLSQTANAAGFTVGTILNVVIVAAHVDTLGNIHRSAPSIGASFTISAATSYLNIAISEVYLGMYTNRQGFFEVYLSVNNDLYAKVGQVLFHTVPQTLVIALATPRTNTLYTEGGTIENIMPPPAKTFWVAKERVWLISAENPLEVYYSKKLFPLEGVNFTDAFVIRLDDAGGPATAGASLDDKVIVFKSSSVYAIFGEGPDETGNGEFNKQQVSYEVGCINVRSIATTNQGVFFASKRGIYLITRDLQIVFIGAPVDEFDETLITQALVLDDRHQVWFFCSNGETICFDTYHSHWYTNKTQIARAAAQLSNTAYYTNTGFLLTESRSVYTDNAVNYSVKLKSNKIQLVGMQSYQRTRKLLIDGTANGAMDFSLVLTYDLGSTSITETFTALASTRSTWEFKPRCQKHETFDFELTLSGANRGLDIQQFNLEVGAKKGQAKINSSDRIQGV